MSNGDGNGNGSDGSELTSSAAMCSAKSPWSARTPTAGEDLTLPASGGEELLGLDGAGADAHHRLAKALGGFGDGRGVVVVGDRLNNGLAARGRVTRLEDARPDKNTFGAEL